MSTTQHTGHYNLPTFGDNPNDRPSWRGDFTDAMIKIDNQMYANATDITTATAAANNAQTAAQQAKKSADNAAELARTNKTDIAELDGYFSELGVTSPQTAQNLMNTINGKAEDTDLTALRGTVSSLSGKVDGKADASQVYTKAQADTTFTKQGGYSGTAQTLNNNINGLNDELNKLKAHGVAPVKVAGGNFSFGGIGAGASEGRARYSVYFSPISRMVTAQVFIWSSDTWEDGTSEGLTPSGAFPTTSQAKDNRVLLTTIPERYRPSANAAPRVYADTVNDKSIFLQAQPNGALILRNFATIEPGTYINMGSVMLSWYALSADLDS